MPRWPVAKHPARGLVPLLSAVLVVLPLLLSHGVHAQDGTVATDKAALEALYDATAGATNWTTKTNWKSSEPLGSWHGVTTDNDGRVTGIDLAAMALRARFPPPWVIWTRSRRSTWPTTT